MRNYITINQLAFSQLSQKVNIKIDLIDASIFEYIYKFAISNNAKKQIINNKLYIWCSYQKIIDDNPLLCIKSKRVIARRLEKLVKIGLLEKITDKKEGNKTFFNVTDLAYTLVINGTDLSTVEYKGVSTVEYNNRELDNRELDIKENIKENPNLNIEACEEWFKYKKYKTKAPKTKTLNFLSKYPKETQQQIVNTSIMNGYKGLFPPKQQKVSNEINLSEYGIAL